LNITLDNTSDPNTDLNKDTNVVIALPLLAVWDWPSANITENSNQDWVQLPVEDPWSKSVFITSMEIEFI